MFLSWIKNCFYRQCLYRKENKSIQFNSTASCCHLVLIITLIFVWILSVKDVTWICFRRTFCNIFLDISGFWDGIWYIFDFDLICLFQWIVFICHVVSSLPHHDVIRKECHGKHVLPLWSPRSKWPIQEISLVSLTLGNFLPGNWPCAWHSCLIYLLIMWLMTCGRRAEDEPPIFGWVASCERCTGCADNIADDFRRLHVIRMQQAIQSNHLVPCFQNGRCYFESKSRDSSANKHDKFTRLKWSVELNNGQFLPNLVNEQVSCRLLSSVESDGEVDVDPVKDTGSVHWKKRVPTMHDESVQLFFQESDSWAEERRMVPTRNDLRGDKCKKPATTRKEKIAPTPRGVQAANSDDESDGESVISHSSNHTTRCQQAVNVKTGFLDKPRSNILIKHRWPHMNQTPIMWQRSYPSMNLTFASLQGSVRWYSALMTWMRFMEDLEFCPKFLAYTTYFAIVVPATSQSLDKE